MQMWRLPVGEHVMQGTTSLSIFSNAFLLRMLYHSCWHKELSKKKNQVEREHGHSIVNLHATENRAIRIAWKIPAKIQITSDCWTQFGTFPISC